VEAPVEEAVSVAAAKCKPTDSQQLG